MRRKFMGRRAVAVSLTAALAASMLMTGCNKTDSETSAAVTETETGTEGETETEEPVTISSETSTAADLLADRNIDLADYIELGEYKGIEVTKVEAEVYTEEDFEKDIQQYLNYQGEYDLEEITDHEEAELGDTVAIDYVGTMDGEEFSGGSGSSDLTLGSGSFIDGFEDGLVGAKVGDEVVLDLTFPEDYSSSSLAGQDVTFTVTVNGLYTKQIHEFTDDMANSMFGYDSVEEAKLAIINSTNTDNQEEAEETMQSEMITKLIDASTIKAYPEDLHQEYYDTYYNYYNDYATSYGYDLETFLSNYYGMTEDDLKTAAESYADSQCSYFLVLMSIADKEGLSVTPEEVEDYVAAEIEENSLTASSFWSQVTEQDVRENLLGNKAIDLVMDNVVYVEADDTESETETETTAE